jgi:hypothetical protein
MLFYFVITLHGTGLRVAEATRLKVKHLKRVPDNAARSDAYRKQLELAVGKGDKQLSELDRGKIIDDAVSQLYDYRILVEPDNQLKHYKHQRAVVPLIEMTSRFDSLLTILVLNLARGDHRRHRTTGSATARRLAIFSPGWKKDQIF